jgi:hypothetical protein
MYDIQRPTYRLSWDDTTPYPGLVVVLRGGAFGDYELIVELVGDGDEAQIVSRLRDLATQRALVDHLATLLVEWELTENGDPLPPTRQGLGRLDVPMLVSIALSWIGAASTVHAAPAEAAAIESTLTMDPIDA